VLQGKPTLNMYITASLISIPSAFCTNHCIKEPGCELDGRDFDFFLQRPHRLYGPPSLLSNGYGDSFPGGKAAGSLDLQLQSSAKVKNGGAVPPLPNMSCRGA
jgi:hypothetical protein